jgi:hypothetical protein
MANQFIAFSFQLAITVFVAVRRPVKLFLIDHHILKRKRTKFYIEQVMLQSTVLMRMLNSAVPLNIFIFLYLFPFFVVPS